MKRIIYKIALFLLLSLSSISLKSQTLTVTAGTICFDSVINLVISVPISVENMVGVYSFSIYLNYDKSFLTYTGYNVDNPALVNTSVVNSSSSGQVFITYSPDTVPINIQNDTVFHINFALNSAASTILEWSYARFWGQIADSIPSVQVNGATLSAPAFIQQPVSQSVCVGSNSSVEYTIQTIDTAQIYQWQFSQDGGSTWTDLINDNYYQGVHTSHLVVVDPQVQMNNYLFHCILIGPCTSSSHAASLNFVTTIMTQPHDTLISLGGTAVFKAKANGTAPAPTYLWEVSTDGGVTWSSTTLFPAVTTSSLTIIGPPTTWNGYKFRCIVNGQCSPPADTTHIASLWVGTQGIDEPGSLGIKIYPNPVQDYLHINIENAHSTYTFLLYDITGRQVMQIYDITDSFTSDLSKFRQGLYFYRLIDIESGVEAEGKVIFNPDFN